MADVKHMVPGFNHNVRHRGKAYHIQTEDSGSGNPQITTHLFVGGNILASKKTSYADITGAENLAAVVRELMEEQHKEMLRNLVNGVYDGADEALAAQARAYQPGQLEPAGIAPAPGGRVDVNPQATPPPIVLRAPAPSPPLRVVPPPARRPAPPAAQARSAPPPLPRAPAAAPPLPSRPAGAEAAETLFGEDLISEKSLDEVILSYLAEDLGQKKA